ncbi:MAG: EamA family transporter [Chitinophagaceae bacterium]|nr:EamA family transporter [Chitinophagaceae bacterium]
MQGESSQASTTKIIAAFAVVYIVWGSTYFFIRLAIEEMPVTVMGALRFLIAGALMLGWCALQKEKLFRKKDMLPAFFTGLLLLFVGNGAVAWSEQFIASSLVAVFIASSPMWFVLLDYTQWKVNFSSRSTITGILLGFIGILLLFGRNMTDIFYSTGAADKWEILAFGALTIGSISWAAGSLYSKYRSSAFSGALNSGWQMLGAGIAFAITATIRNDWRSFRLQEVSVGGWLSIIYLVTMGSLVGYSSFVWLLKVRPAAQVSTHAYVNPVVAVLLGVFFANETITSIQVGGLAVILAGVLLVNLAKYRKVREV